MNPNQSIVTSLPLAGITSRVVSSVLLLMWLGGRIVYSAGISDVAEFAEGAKNIAVPFYSKINGKSVAVLRAGRLFQDFERKGFFRIGVLPVLTVEDLTLEVRDATQLAPVLDEATRCLAGKDNIKRVLDVRQFSIIFTGQTNACVRARRMRVDSASIWRLEDVTFTSASSPPLSLRRVRLHTSGSRAGELSDEARAGFRSIQLSNLLSTVPQPKTSL